MKPDETIFIPLGAIHRIENPYKKPVKIIEAQVGSILKEDLIAIFSFLKELEINFKIFF